MVYAKQTYDDWSDVGYYSNVEGVLTFTPEISDKTLRELRTKLDTFDYFGEFDRVGWSDWSGDSGKAYDLENEAHQLVHILAEAGAVAHGVIDVRGEDNTDIWRLVFADGDVRVERAKIVWPDGTEVKSTY